MATELGNSEALSPLPMGERLARSSEPGEGAEKFGDPGSSTSPQRGEGVWPEAVVFDLDGTLADTVPTLPRR